MMADVELIISWFQSGFGKSGCGLFIKVEAIFVFDAKCSVLNHHKNKILSIDIPVKHT